MGSGARFGPDQKGAPSLVIYEATGSACASKGRLQGTYHVPRQTVQELLDGVVVFFLELHARPFNALLERQRSVLQALANLNKLRRLHA